MDDSSSSSSLREAQRRSNPAGWIATSDVVGLATTAWRGRSLALVSLFAVGLTAAEPQSSIDREALVRRHNPVVRSVDPDAPLTVGNGRFAFTCDITGLQTFADYYHRHGVPTETLARWCWVSDENVNNYTLADASRDFVQADGRTVAYPTSQSSPAGDWLRKNPRLQPLGQIRFEYTKSDGTPLQPEDIQDPHQELDLWTGIITSRFKIEGVPVDVTTACDPDRERVVFAAASPLFANSRLKVVMAFPRGHDLGTKNTPGLDWSDPGLHRSVVANSRNVVREVGNTEYNVRVSSGRWSSKEFVGLREVGLHKFQFVPDEPRERIDCVVEFYPARTPPAVFGLTDPILLDCAAHWQDYWRRTAAVDFSGSTDPRASELERRIILSRYLMATQEGYDPRT